jgi:hypothetical protein
VTKPHVLAPPWAERVLECRGTSRKTVLNIITAVVHARLLSVHQLRRKVHTGTNDVQVTTPPALARHVVPCTSRVPDLTGLDWSMAGALVLYAQPRPDRLLECQDSGEVPSTPFTLEELIARLKKMYLSLSSGSMVPVRSGGRVVGAGATWGLVVLVVRP